jgi:altronate dehydratase small subunit
MGDSHIIAVEPEDNVATAIRDVSAGETIAIDIGNETTTVEIEEDIQFGHKIALKTLEPGETIRKYGLSIGDASQSIKIGEWVHAHNVESNYGRGDLANENSSEGPHGE